MKRTAEETPPLAVHERRGRHENRGNTKAKDTPREKTPWARAKQSNRQDRQTNYPTYIPRTTGGG